MRAIWSGTISFGLVTIPVKLYSAIASSAGMFRMLHDKHQYPIQYKRWCEKCDNEVPWDQIVKGIEVSKNRYVVITPEELKKMKPEKTQSIDIREIVQKQQIDPLYFRAHYFIGPQSKKQKSYFLFKEVLESRAIAALGTFVLRDKEHV